MGVYPTSSTEQSRLIILGHESVGRSMVMFLVMSAGIRLEGLNQ